MIEYKPITFCERYILGSDGSVYDTPRKKYIKPYYRTEKHGKRMEIRLMTDMGRRKYYISYLVATHFIPNPNNFKFVVYKDDDPSNYNVSNLLWSRTGTSDVNAIIKLKEYVDKLNKKDKDKDVEYRIIPFAPNYYCSSKGKIYNIKHRSVGGSNTQDYQRAHFYLPISNKPLCKSIHRTIYESFNPDFDQNLEINHINRIRYDNRIENLEAVTKQENINHMYETSGLYDMYKSLGIVGTEGTKVEIDWT